MKLHFFRCAICGKVIAILSDTGVPTVCCGQTMRELALNDTDGAFEKHVPVFCSNNNAVSVCVGSVPHPMTDIHSITWIGLQSAFGFQFVERHPGNNPKADFHLCPEDRAEAVYAYCNLHGLWYLDADSAQ